MIDLSKISGFDWDAGNIRKSEDKHGVSMAEAEQVFFNTPLLLLEDASHSQNEARMHALGQDDEGRALHISFTLRKSGQLIRVISARDMHRKERVIYDQAS
ncbi:MAG: BrnT family toxin [Burkholderiaceae bacterium]|nr:BrnT family toxin [Burkholderiaceae bacterium]